MSDRTDGLEDYTLGKDYGENKAGTVIPVDPARKLWLDGNGYSRDRRKLTQPALSPKDTAAAAAASLPAVSPTPDREEV